MNCSTFGGNPHLVKVEPKSKVALMILRTTSMQRGTTRRTDVRRPSENWFRGSPFHLHWLYSIVLLISHVKHVFTYHMQFNVSIAVIICMYFTASTNSPTVLRLHICAKSDFEFHVEKCIDYVFLSLFRVAR